MTTDRVFVLLMMVLLMMAGCFEATSTTEAEEEQDSTSGDEGTSDNVPNGDSDEDSSSNEPVDSSGGQGSDSTNSGTSTSNYQERIWYSSGWTYDSTWSDGLFFDGGQRCMEFGPLYDNSTGQYIGEQCKRYGYPEYASDWNTTNCTSIGGTPYWSNIEVNNNGTNNSDSGYRYPPTCKDIPLVTINTNAGQALLIYQQSGSFTWNTICNGVSQSVYKSSGSEYTIVPGSSMNCTHELTLNQIPYEYYLGDNGYIYNQNVGYDGVITQSMWSIVYALQDTVVV
tara:strand:+ start:602 stop:1450 length:849 start_codon:yes stop_codon:yes gene_type:complete